MVDLLKRLAVLLSGLSLSSCTIEDTSVSGSVGVALTSDSRRFPMKGMLDSYAREEQLCGKT